MNTAFKEVPATNDHIARRKPVSGIGTNDAGYLVHTAVNGNTLVCPYYRVWLNILKRCYNPKEIARTPTYSDCTVCDEWLIFSNFRAWMEKQDWQGKEIDKDILVSGNRAYSPETCFFVPHRLNSLLTSRQACRGDFPIGVSKANRGRYKSAISKGGKLFHIGTFDSVAEAEKAYLAEKSSHILSESEKYEEPLKSALIRISNEVAEGIYFDNHKTIKAREVK